MMKYMLTVLLVALALLGLSACGGGAPTSGDQLAPSQPTALALPPTAPPEPTAAPPAASPTAPAAEPTAAPRAPTAVSAGQPASDAAALLIYHKSGGIMGIDETLTVRADGTLVLTSRGHADKTVQVPAAQLDQLRALITSAEFAKLAPHYQADGADLITYTITVPGGTPSGVSTMDGAATPAILEQVLQVLNQLRLQV